MKGKLKALYLRHDKQVLEMEKRGYIYKSSLNKNLATGCNIQDQSLNTIDKQKNILKQKNCDCNIWLFMEKIKRGFLLLVFKWKTK